MDASVVNGGLALQEKQNGATQATVQRRDSLRLQRWLNLTAQIQR